MRMDKLFMIGILTIVQAVSTVFQAIYLAKAIVYMYEGTARSAVLSSFAAFIVAFLLRHFLLWLKSRIAYQYAEKKSLHLQNLLVRKLFALGPKAVGQEGSGSLVTVCLEGIQRFRTYLELLIPRMMAVIAIPIILLLYVFAIDNISAIILTIVMPVQILFLILLGLAVQKQKDAKWVSYQLLARHFVDSLRGLVTLKYLGRSKKHSEAIWSVSDQYRLATMRTLRVAFLSGFSLDFFSSLSIAIVAVELGLRLVNGSIGLEASLIILILAPEYFLPVRELGNDYHATMDGKKAGEYIHRLLDRELVSDDDDSILLGPWNEQSLLSMQNVTKFSNIEGPALLKNINVQVKGFQKIGIIGMSGAGKSTLIDILSGFSRPSSGRFTVNGSEISHLSISVWQEQIAYIPQHPYIFSATIAENIAWYAPDASRQKISEAARLTGLMELVNGLPKGLDEKIGQGGRALSGGEEQRIALARALLERKPVLLFDEPTAHLDIETEYDLKKVMLPLFANKLVFFATHRLHWMRNMDLILVLEEGELVESGTHEELYRKQGSYYQFAQAQREGIGHEVFSNIY